MTSRRTVGTGRDDPRQWVKAAYLLIDATQTGPPGKLPPRAEVAAKLDINEATVTRAYRELTALGIIREVPGLGYFGGRT